MAVGNLYVVSVASTAQTTVKTLIEITGAATSVTLLERAYISQNSFDTSENLSAKIQRITTTGGTGAHTARALNPGSAAYGGTVKVNLSSEPTYTASTELVTQGFNVLSGWLWTPASDDEVIVVRPSALLGIMLNTAPSASMDFAWGCTIREIG